MSRRWLFGILLIVALLAWAALPLAAQSPVSLLFPYVVQNCSGISPSVATVEIVDELTAPIKFIPAGDGSGRMFVVDQIGLIHVMRADGTVLKEPFLDLRERMVALNANYDERGLLGLAFHPQFRENRRFFVYYSAPLREGAPEGWNHTSHISEFSVSHADRNKADPSSERILLQVDQPQSNHNAGDIVFGPDGYLYIPLGDGGRANDVGLGHPPLGNGQDISTLLGSILRIDVDGEEPYGIPGDNPFVGREGRDEIYAYGFRNPYRISFDVGGQREFWVSDVGQNRWEEVNLVDKGGNYGWNLKEGTYCFDPESPGNPPTTCADVGPRGESLIDPVIEFANSSSPGGGISRAVVGGYVYRGSTMPQYIGRYIFGGWSESFNAPSGILLMARRSSISGQIWTIDELQVTAGITQPVFVLSFGYDPADELYVLTSRMAGPSGNTGAIYKLVSPGEDRLLVSVWDQEIISDTVTIAEVISDGPGWMVIHAEAQGGGPGPVIGYAPLTDGRNLFVTVNIDKSGATGTLYAMPHVDVGIIGAYEFPGADVPVRVNGQVLTKPFKALNMEPLVEVMDQEVVEGTVTLPRAVMKGPGWMVIHAEAPGGGPGPVIGHTAISDGLNISVKVPIDVSNATQTLYAMLHYDRGTMGVYEFPGADVPVQVDGRIAMAPFNLIVSQGTVAVDMINLAFRPKVVIIRAGSTVRWTNREALPHTATDDGGAWDSSTMDQGDIFSRQFGTAGVYRYHCRFHGASDGVGMAGTVVVFP